jgi:hypothetical protein
VTLIEFEGPVKVSHEVRNIASTLHRSCNLNAEGS